MAGGFLRSIPPHIEVGNRRVLHFMGTGEDVEEEVTTEYTDIIVKSGLEEKVCHLFVQYLKNKYTSWDRIVLRRFLKNSTLAKYFINEAWLHDIKYIRSLSGFKHDIQLGADYNDYIADRSRSFKKNLRNYNNRLEKKGALKFKIVSQHNEIDNVLNQLKTLQIRRFSSVNEISVFENPKFTEFQRELMHILLDKNQLHLGLLYLNDKIIAVEYNFNIDATTYAYQGSFDSSIEKQSVGFLSINYMIKNSIESRKRIYDFMMNDERTYMTSYGCKQSPILSCCFFNTSVLNKLMYSIMLLKIFIKETWKIVKSIAR